MPPWIRPVESVRVRHREAVVAGFRLRQALGDLTDKNNEFRGIFNAVDAKGDIARVRFTAVHRTANPVRSFVRDDGLHRGRLAHHTAGGADVVIFQIADQSARTLSTPPLRRS